MAQSYALQLPGDPEKKPQAYLLELPATATAPSNSIPEQQSNIATPAPTGFFGNIANAVTGHGRKDDGVGEIGFTSVPEEKDQKFEGPLSGAANMLPKPVRNYIGADMRSGGIGLGMFLDPNEEHQAKIIKHNVPTAEFRRDKHGELEVRYAPHANPEEGWAYVNQPGLSLQDILTFAGEGEKYLIASKLPFLRAGAASEAVPLGTSTLKAGGAGAVATAVGQTLAMPFGGPGPDAGDIAVSGAGGAGGNVIGHSVVATAKAAPGLIKDGFNALADRLPGGATRAAERKTLLEQAQAAAEATARQHAEAMARAEAAGQAQGARIGQVGAALEQSIKDAGDAAAARVAAQFNGAGGGQASRDVAARAQSFGVKLAKSQAEGDQDGLMFLHEAAAGLHGPAAQRAAQAFLADQNAALPQAIKGIAGDPGVLSPTGGVGTARQGVLAAKDAADQAEGAAWDKFNTAVGRVRTRASTPNGAPGGVVTVVKNMLDRLNGSKVFMDVPEFQTRYPHVQQVLSLANRMMDVEDNTSLRDLPDVERIIQLKRFIDSKYEEAGTDAERRILGQLGAETRSWLKTSSEGTLGRRAPVTAAALKEALALSEHSAKTFRENSIMQDILATRRGVGAETQGGQQFTDAEIATRLFGGGAGGLNLRGESVGALKAIREAVGSSSPEWESLRQAALQRFSQGLENALANRQAPPVLTTSKYIADALDKSGEGMQVLFSPEELARLRDVNGILRAAAPPARNMANPSGSGLVAARIAKGILQQGLTAARQVPGVGAAAGAAQDMGAAARVNVETAGPASQGFNIAKRLADLWNVRNGEVSSPDIPLPNGKHFRLAVGAADASSAAGAAGAQTERQNEPGQ